MLSREKIEQEIRAVQDPHISYVEAFDATLPDNVDPDRVILRAFIEAKDIPAGPVEALDPDKMEPVDATLLLFNAWRQEPTEERTYRLIYACIGGFLCGSFLGEGVQNDVYEQHVTFLNKFDTLDKYTDGGAMMTLAYWSCVFSRVAQDLYRGLFRSGNIGDYFFANWVEDNYSQVDIAEHALRTMPAATFNVRESFTRMNPVPGSKWDVMAGVYDAAGRRGSDISLMREFNFMAAVNADTPLTAEQRNKVARYLIDRGANIGKYLPALQIVDGESQREIDALKERLAAEQKDKFNKLHAANIMVAQKNAEIKQLAEQAAAPKAENENLKAAVVDHAKANEAWEAEYAKQLQENRKLRELLESAQRVKREMDLVKQEKSVEQDNQKISVLEKQFDELYRQANLAVSERDGMIQERNNMINSLRKALGLPPVLPPPPPPDTNVPTVGALSSLVSSVPNNKADVDAIIEEAENPANSKPPQLGTVRNLIQFKGIPTMLSLPYGNQQGPVTEVAIKKPKNPFAYMTAPDLQGKEKKAVVVQDVGYVPISAPAEALPSTYDISVPGPSPPNTQTVQFNPTVPEPTRPIAFEPSAPPATVVVPEEVVSVTPLATTQSISVPDTPFVTARSISIPDTPLVTAQAVVPLQKVASTVVQQPPTQSQPFIPFRSRVNFEARVASFAGRQPAPLPPYKFVELAEPSTPTVTPLSVPIPTTPELVVAPLSEMQKAQSIAEEWWRSHPRARRMDMAHTAKKVVHFAADYIPSKNDFSGVDTKK